MEQDEECPDDALRGREGGSMDGYGGNWGGTVGSGVYLFLRRFEREK